MEPFRDDLAAELRALRPAPSPAFAAELDARAAAGFPRRSPLGDSPQRRLARRLRAMPPRRTALATAATALAAVAVATAIVAVGEPQHSSHAKGTLAVTGTAQPNPQVEAQGHTGVARHHGGSGDSAGSQYDNVLPSTARLESAGEAAASRTGPYAYEAGHRDVQRTAAMVLGADPSQVPGDAARVFEAVHSYKGVVLSSSVRGGGGSGQAGAVFDLLIPSAKLGGALAAFSEIGEVRSRREAGEDITSPTIRLGERLRDSRATVEGLLVQLARADTDAKRAEVELELRGERRRAASLRSQVTKLDRRSNLSRVSLRIETGAGATSTSNGRWGIDDALGDAGHILAIAAGVTLIGLAVLAPIALIALLAWLAHRAWVRQRRERALG